MDALSEMSFYIAPNEQVAGDNLDRGKFRDHYTNDVSFLPITFQLCFTFNATDKILLITLRLTITQYVSIEKNHVNDVGVKYDGLSRKVMHKPSHWRCEDEIERGK